MSSLCGVCVLGAGVFVCSSDGRRGAVGCGDVKHWRSGLLRTQPLRCVPQGSAQFRLQNATHQKNPSVHWRVRGVFSLCRYCVDGFLLIQWLSLRFRSTCGRSCNKYYIKFCWLQTCVRILNCLSEIMITLTLAIINCSSNLEKFILSDSVCCLHWQSSKKR